MQCRLSFSYTLTDGKGMKRYALYAFEEYYPIGGANDFIASSDDIEALKNMGDLHLKQDPYHEFANIFDRELEKPILERYLNGWEPYEERLL